MAENSATVAELVERNRTFLAAYSAADFETGGRAAEDAFLAAADTDPGRILRQDPPPVRSHADLVAALRYIAEDSDYVDTAHARILGQALAFLDGEQR